MAGSFCQVGLPAIIVVRGKHMADMSNIVNFKNSDGLPPDVVLKLNHNFWHVVSKITDPEIIAVSGTTLPEPRTTETLFYNTDTGDLYVWGENEVLGGQVESGWQKVDMNLIHSEDSAPASDEHTHGEVIWYDTDAKEFYILTGSTALSLPVRWISLEAFIRAVAIDVFSSMS